MKSIVFFLAVLPLVIAVPKFTSVVKLPNPVKEQLAGCNVRKWEGVFHNGPVAYLPLINFIEPFATYGYQECLEKCLKMKACGGVNYIVAPTFHGLCYRITSVPTDPKELAAYVADKDGTVVSRFDNWANSMYISYDCKPVFKDELNHQLTAERG